eukprot:TRINITY_DN35357_c0_g1_i1.p1 TRINITY_DN35357_c0_g1~~TRINITY_DN35357_c0_g1_i1.p1  ORF type:complete len:512 (+),score=144.20 TRINITY_DN35357_c0_g1_i1:106-1536(+)
MAPAAATGVCAFALLPALQAAAAAGLGRAPSRADAARHFAMARAPPAFSFGLFADTQYGQGKPTGSRHYRLSMTKVQEMCSFFQEDYAAGHKPEVAVNLGDLTQDKAAQDRPAVLRALADCFGPAHGVPLRHLLGNHDFKGDRSVAAAMDGLGIAERYYAMDVPAAERAGWELLVVDTTDVSTHGNPPGSKEAAAAAQWSARLKQRKAPNWEDHNGAVGEKQMGWLSQRLERACAAGRQVIIFAHAPLFTGPKRNHDMHAWNSAELVALLARNRCVRLWVNGHVHVMRHVVLHVDSGHHVHLWTFPGMVQTPRNSYAVVEAYPDALLVRGASWGEGYVMALNLSAPLAQHGYNWNLSSYYLGDKPDSLGYFVRGRTYLTAPGEPFPDPAARLRVPDAAAAAAPPRGAVAAAAAATPPPAARRRQEGNPPPAPAPVPTLSPPPEGALRGLLPYLSVPLLVPVLLLFRLLPGAARPRR